MNELAAHSLSVRRGWAARQMRLAGVLTAVLAADIWLVGCQAGIALPAATGAVTAGATAVGTDLGAAGSVPVVGAGGVLSTCISTLQSLKAQMAGSTALPVP